MNRMFRLSECKAFLVFITLIDCLLKATGAQQLSVACPAYRSEEAVVLQPDGEQTVSEPASATRTASYIWSNVASTGNWVACNGTTVPLAKELKGQTCLSTFNFTAAPSAKLCYDEEQLFLEALSTKSTLDLSTNAQVTVCQTDTFLLQLSWKDQSGEHGQILLSKTGCIAIWGNDSSWFAGSKGAVQNPSSSYAAAAGFPATALDSKVTSYSVQDQSNPCLAPEPGYANGLTTQYYAAEGVVSQSSGLLSLGAADFSRCDCPNHQAAGEAWAGSPQLSRSYASDFGAGFSGEFLAQENPLGGELAAWKLVCLQYNGLAQLIIDGQLLISPKQTSPGGAGYAEICRALQLEEGWHNLNILYTIGPGQAVSVMRFFVIDATGPDGLNSTNGGEAIEWTHAASLCRVGDDSADSNTCNEPYSCCNFRTSYGCGSGSVSQSSALPQSPPFALPPGPVQYSLPAYAGFGRGGSFPGMGTVTAPVNASGPSREAQLAPLAAVQEPAAAEEPSSQPIAAPEQPGSVPLPPSKATAAAPLQPILRLPLRPDPNASAPVQRTLPSQYPAPPGAPACTINVEPCWLYQTGSNQQMRMATLDCNASTASSLQYTANVIFRTGMPTGWLSVTPSSGVASSSASTPFVLTIDTSELVTGEHYAELQIVWTDGSSAAASLSKDLVLVLVGPAKVQFDRVLALTTTGKAGIAASASLDFPATRTLIDTNATLSSATEQQFFSFQHSGALAGIGGAIIDRINSSIALPSQYEDPTPSLALDASFEVILPLSGYQTYSCGTLTSNALTSAASQPQCQLFAVDMAFCSRRGLLTSRSAAQLVLACTSKVTICSDCFSVAGPAVSSAQLLSYASEAAASAVHHILLSWPVDYSGQITVGVQSSGSSPSCSLSVAPSVGSNFTEAVIPQPLQFMVEAATPVRSAAYEVVHECSGSECAFSV